MRELEWNRMPPIEWIKSGDSLAYREEHLGPVGEIKNWLTDLKVNIGEAPIAVAADRAAEKLGLQVPAWSQLLGAEKRSWLLSNTFSLWRDGGLLEPDAVGIELLFRDDRGELNTGAKIHVHSLFPGPQCRILGKAGVEGEFVCDAELLAPGKLSVPTGNPDPTEAAFLTARGGLRARANANLSISASMTICTAKVAAIGTGDIRAQWEFYKDSLSLVGRPIETWTGLLLPVDTASLEYKAKIWVVFGGGLFRFARSTEWTTLICDLPVTV